jgi:hypothetical protein
MPRANVPGNLEGTWDITSLGSHVATLTLVQEGSKITGSIGGSHLAETGKGHVTGDRMILHMKGTAHPAYIHELYDVTKVDATHFTGTLKTKFGGGRSSPFEQDIIGTKI